MFKQDLFLKILKLLLEDYYGTISNMAEKLDIDRTYIYYQNANRFKGAPKVSTLRKMVNNSDGILDYMDMMWVCGYLDEQELGYSITEDSVLQKIKNNIKNKGIAKKRALKILNEYVTCNDSDKLSFEKTELVSAIKTILKDYK